MHPFAQADSGLNRKYEGTGLGLTLSLGLATLHGGDLRLESTLGEGTRAIVTLPSRPRDRRQPSDAGEVSPPCLTLPGGRNALRAAFTACRLPALLIEGEGSLHPVKLSRAPCAGYQ